ncbi:MAG: DUF1592 domain-containing protein [Planctomyces sp.]
MGRMICVYGCVLPVWHILCGAIAGAAGVEPPDFSVSGSAFLQKYCLKCHNDQESSAELSLQGLTDNAALIRSRRSVTRILRVVTSGEMPPADQQRPELAEAERFTGELAAILDHADRTAKPDPGRVTMRRLNRTEYRNTIRDLIGVSFDPAADFPADDIGHGFDNIGDVLSLSPVLMERYFEASETIMSQAILPVPPKIVTRRLASVYTEPASGEVAGKFMDEGFRRLSTDGADGVSTGPLHTPYKWEDGEYVFRARVYGQSGSGAPLRVAVLLHGAGLQEPSSEEELAAIAGNVLRPAKILKIFEVAADSREKAEIWEISVPAVAGRDRMMIGQLRPAEGQPAGKLWVEYLALDGPLDTRPASQRRLLACDAAKSQPEQTREVLSRFLRRAFRRPVQPDELERSVRLVEQSLAAGEAWESGVQFAMQAALCSPSFLFRVERDVEPLSSEIRPLNEHQLASRLSYFLWSSMPDDELLDLADAGQLTAQLQGQVRRLLQDPRAATLVQSFAMQWLQLQRLDLVSPDATLFPGWSSELRQSMRRETELFIDSVLREDRSLLDLIAADYTFLNGPLAKHYGIADTNGNVEGQSPTQPVGQPIQGSEFVRVSLPGSSRGGLLTQASVLTVTSNPTRTSPVKRGRWVLEQILGAPPPAPPPNVPELPNAAEDIAGAPLRKRLEVHRSNPACANCHAKMDPIGFALENFDAVGRYRVKDGNFDVDATGELPDGTVFSGPLELKAVILQRRQEFARCVTEKLLTYAIGRGLEYYDRPVVESILRKLETADYRMSAVIEGIVQSEAFRLRRGLDAAP